MKLWTSYESPLWAVCYTGIVARALATKYCRMYILSTIEVFYINAKRFSTHVVLSHLVKQFHINGSRYISIVNLKTM